MAAAWDVLWRVAVLAGVLIALSFAVTALTDWIAERWGRD